MFVNVNAHPGSVPKALGELGELSRARIIQSEFKYSRGTEIFGQAEPADYIYQVADGAVRSYKLLSDGRRQIGAFHLVGDIFGLENGTTHRFTAEAVIDTTVRLVKRRSLEQVAESDVLVTLDLLNMTTSNLQHAEDHMLLLGRKTSLERVAAFLLEMDRRLTAAGVLALPMSRRDIADYLGLTLETVSRALSYLHGKGILGFLGQNQRQIVLLDRARLAELDLSSSAKPGSFPTDLPSLWTCINPTLLPRFSFEPFSQIVRPTNAGGFEGPVDSAAPPSEHIPSGGAVAFLESTSSLAVG